MTLDATFATIVTGVGHSKFSYQWRHNGTEINGATGDTLIITNAMESNGGSYDCIVTNQFRDTNTSNIAVLVVTSKSYVSIGNDMMCC